MGRKFLNGTTVQIVEEGNTVNERYDSAYLWTLVIVFEHIAFMLRIIIRAALPDEPAWLRTAKEQLAYKIKTEMVTEEEKQRRDDHASAHKAKMDEKRDTRKALLLSKARIAKKN